MVGREGWKNTAGDSEKWGVVVRVSDSFGGWLASWFVSWFVGWMDRKMGELRSRQH